jgi:hypothetical protein
MSAQRFPDCHHTNLGLTRDQQAALTGFTSRAVKALAHLREAWCIADPANMVAVEAAIRALLHGHSLHDGRGLCLAVLRHGLDRQQAAQLLHVVGLTEKAEGAA